MKTIKILFILSLIKIFVSCESFAQNQMNNWYFGSNAGLDFNGGSPVALTNGMVSTTEGSACVSDANGVLLFYTEGVNVWNANHVVMPNGSGLFGSGSSTQSALIVNQPGNPNLYYIFTTDAAGGVNGFCYSVVDMNMVGGLGDVTMKNVQLLTPASEKITAVNHANGTDIWVVTHELGTDAFYSYLLTSSGLNLVPVITNIGSVHNVGGNEIGYLKASHNGKQLACAIRYLNTFDLFDFDNATGILSNYVPFPANYPHSYGVEFSPNDTRLYTTSGLGPGFVFQFDLTAGSAAGIVNSAYCIDTTNGGNIGTLQLAPDCKIYVVNNFGSGTLDVIDSPDSLGAACNYIVDAVSLGGKTNQLGLPNFYQSYCATFFSVMNTCLGDSTYFTLTNSTTLFGAQWDFGDTVSGGNNISYLLNPVHYFSSAGTYSIQLIEYFSNGSVDTIITSVSINAVPVFNLGNDTTLCAGDSIVLNAACGASNYLWQNSSTDSVLSITGTGTYYVTASNGVCSFTDTIVVNFSLCSAPGVSFMSSDTTFCDKQCLDYTDLSTNNPTSWQWSFPGGIPSSSTLQNPLGICYNAFGSFDVTLIACNASGCDTLILTGFINEFAPPAVPVVLGSSDTLYAPTGYSYQWYFNSIVIPGATNYFYVYQQPGSYFVIITDSNGCASSSQAIYTSINNLSSIGFSFNIFPNPSDGNFTLEFESDKPQKNAGLKITDILGRLIVAEMISEISGKISKTIHLQNTGKGIYFIYLTLDDKQVVKKMVVN